MLHLDPYEPVSAMPPISRDLSVAVHVDVRVVLRQPERTLTAAEANDLRNRVYTAIHQGTSGEWSK